MTTETVLIVEDDPAMLRGLKDNFEFDGFNVCTAGDGEKGLEAALELKPDLIVLDLMLPRINGYEVCRRIREQGMDVPVIMLTAKSEESDVVLGLNIGADDYVTKPFSIKELLARANAFLRRRRESRPTVYRIGKCTLDVTSRRLTRNGKEIPLTPREFDLLAFLASRPGRALTRDQILRNVWGHGVFVNSRSVDRCITTLRNKIELEPSQPVFIKTVREVGYRFELPGQR